MKMYTLLSYTYDLSTSQYICVLYWKVKMSEIWWNDHKVKELRPQTNWNGHYPLTVKAGSDWKERRENDPVHSSCWALAWCVAFVISFNSLKISLKWAACPCYRWQSWGSKRLNYLSKVTELLRVTARIQTQDGDDSRDHVLTWHKPEVVINQYIFVCCCIEELWPKLAFAFVSSRVIHSTQRYFHEKMNQWNWLCLPC